MMDLAEWAANLLLSRGALVEADGNGGIRALLPPSLAEQLGSSEWLSLKFGAEAGADDPGEWLERLGRLLPAESLVAGARLRAPLAAPPLDVAAMLERELVIQNGIYRLVEDFSARASCFFFTFQYTVESDERHLGMVTVCLNASARSLPPQPETLLRAVRDQTEDDPAFSVPVEALAQIYPAALRAAEVETRKLITGLQETARRRLERDARRIDSYYRDLGAQIEKRIARRSGDPLTAEKERSRLRATELDRAAKLEDLRRKYSLRIRLNRRPCWRWSCRCARSRCVSSARSRNARAGSTGIPFWACWSRRCAITVWGGPIRFTCARTSTACAGSAGASVPPARGPTARPASPAAAAGGTAGRGRPEG